jgi:ATP synthase protein I
LLLSSDRDSQKSDSPNDGKRSVWVQLAAYSQLAVIFPAATVAGYLIGLALDHWLHTSWIYLVGLILGIIAGFVELIRAALANAK